MRIDSFDRHRVHGPVAQMMDQEESDIYASEMFSLQWPSRTVRAVKQLQRIWRQRRQRRGGKRQRTSSTGRTTAPPAPVAKGDGTSCNKNGKSCNWSTMDQSAQASSQHAPASSQHAPVPSNPPQSFYDKEELTKWKARLTRSLALSRYNFGSRYGSTTGPQPTFHRNRRLHTI